MTGLANRYANLVGSNKIKDEWQKINAGFDSVQAEMDAVNAELDQKADRAFAQVNGLSASTKDDTLNIAGGTGITISENPNTKTLTITSTGTATPGAHGSAHTEFGADPIPNATPTTGGLMSAADKAKLDSMLNFYVLEPSTATIQAAIDAANAAGGGVVHLPVGEFILTPQGTNPAINRKYGIVLKSRVTLKGSGSNLTTLKAADNANMDIIITDPTGSTFTSDIGVIGLKVDGNFENQSDPHYFNIWIRNSNRVVMDDFYSYHSTNWGIRIENVTNFFGGTILSEQGADVNADGFHFVDVDHAVIDKLIINTKGDDGFIIEAVRRDVHDITVGELIVTAPVEVEAAGRGIYMTVGSASTEQRNIYNITIKNAVTHNCKGYALVLEKGNFYNIDISLSDYGSYVGASFIVGHATLGPGSIRNSNFNIQSWNARTHGILTTVVDGTIEQNTLNAKIYNSGDGVPAVVLRGERWDANIMVDYNPHGDKTNPSYGIDVFCSKSTIRANVKGASRNMYFRSNASNNTIYLGRLESAVVYDIQLVDSAINNRFIGGEVTSQILDLETSNQFYGVRGADNYGSSSITPNGSGNGVIPHGLVGTPRYVSVGIRGDHQYAVDVQSVDSTNITVRIKNPATNADVTSGTYTIDWKAQL